MGGDQRLHMVSQRRIGPLLLALCFYGPSRLTFGEPDDKLSVVGVALVASPLYVPVAQWIERWPAEPEIGGSSPLGHAKTTAYLHHKPALRTAFPVAFPLATSSPRRHVALIHLIVLMLGDCL